MPGFSGVDEFKYVVEDNSGDLSNEATVTITVDSVNNAPTLVSIGEQTVDEGATLEASVSASDPDGDSVKVTVPGSICQWQ